MKSDDFAEAFENKIKFLNAETRAAIEEVDEMIAGGQGDHFAGSTENFLTLLTAN